MQRSGFLKLLAHQVSRNETNNLQSLGKQFIATVTKRARVSPPYDESLIEYVRVRLFDRVYADLRKTVLGGQPAALELQDLYLSDPRLPSSTGKLAENNWRFYPYLATGLDLIKPGTWSAMTRSHTLLAVTPVEELHAYDGYDREATSKFNPLFVTREQSALLLYCFLDNDALVVQPLFEKLVSLPGDGFDERTAGELVPGILRAAITGYRNSPLNVEDRERLAQLHKVANNIERRKGLPYTGGNALSEAIRPRIEPYCDFGLFTKPDRHRFSYRVSLGMRKFVQAWSDAKDTDSFLEQYYFVTLAAIHGIETRLASDDEARQAIARAGEKLKSSLGYTPIRDCALLAGIRLLFDSCSILEVSRTEEVLKEWQKEAPDIVRFTIDRTGALAYVKFLKPVSTPPSATTPAKA